MMTRSDQKANGQHQKECGRAPGLPFRNANRKEGVTYIAAPDREENSLAYRNILIRSVIAHSTSTLRLYIDTAAVRIYRHVCDKYEVAKPITVPCSVSSHEVDTRHRTPKKHT
jgi:hypothetical protein